MVDEQNPHFRSLRIEPQPLEPLRSAFPLRTRMNLPAQDALFLVGDALRVLEPFTGQGIFFALRTAELAASAVLDSRCPEQSYAAAVKQLYQQRARTNEWIRRLMYREEKARWLMTVLKLLPPFQRWLTGNVLNPEGRRQTDRPTRRAPWLPERKR